MDLIPLLFLVDMVDTDDTRRTTSRVWHKLPTDEVTIINRYINSQLPVIFY